MMCTVAIHPVVGWTEDEGSWSVLVVTIQPETYTDTECLFLFLASQEDKLLAGQTHLIVHGAMCALAAGPF